MVTDLCRTKAHFFLDAVKKEIRKISTSFTSQTQNGNSTVAYPILIVKGSDNGLFNRIKDHMLKYDKYMTCEDKRTSGTLVFKFKVSDETETFLTTYGEEKSADHENGSETITIDPKIRLDSLKSLLRKAGLRSGLHCSDVKFANEESVAKCIATVYNCSKLQGERTLFYLLECGFNAYVGSKATVTLVELPNEEDYSVYFNDVISADCFPPKAKIEEEQKSKGGTEDNTSNGKPGDKNTAEEKVTPAPESSTPKPTAVQPVVVSIVSEPVATPNSPAMQMARLAYENLSGAEKVAFLHEYGKSLIPDEEEIVNRRKPQWEKDYALTFENNLRNTMKDEIHDDVTAEVTELLTPKLKNIVRPEVLDTAKKLAFNEMKDLLVLKFKGKYSIVPSDGVWKIFTGHNGKITIETVSIDDLLKQVKS